MQADLDIGTLRVWVDGKLLPLGWAGGVKGRMRWAVSFFAGGDSIQIMHNPELEPIQPALV